MKSKFTPKNTSTRATATSDIRNYYYTSDTPHKVKSPTADNKTRVSNLLEGTFDRRSYIMEKYVKFKN